MKHFFLAAAVGFAFTAQVQAENFTVRMLSQLGSEYDVFDPPFIHAQPGDSITFLPTESGHNVQTINGMIPETAEAFASRIDEVFTITLTVEGVYGLKCLPHYAMGMVMLVQVGNPINLEAARTVRPRGKAKAKFAELFEQVTP